MSWLHRVSDGVARLLGGQPTARDIVANRPDFLAEGLALEKAGDVDGALTSYRLALRTKPDDPKVLQNMAIAFTKTGRMDEAIRCYRKVIEKEPNSTGAQYGLAFLLLRKGDTDGAISHLDEFLALAPNGTDRYTSHARETLATLRGEVEAMTHEATVHPLTVPSASDASEQTHGLQATGTDHLRSRHD
jgi:tetratricopeptide (TPR) repeat protein